MSFLSPINTYNSTSNYNVPLPPIFEVKKTLIKVFTEETLIVKFLLEKNLGEIRMIFKAKTIEQVIESIVYFISEYTKNAQTIHSAAWIGCINNLKEKYLIELKNQKIEFDDEDPVFSEFESYIERMAKNNLAQISSAKPQAKQIRKKSSFNQIWEQKKLGMSLDEGLTFYNLTQNIYSTLGINHPEAQINCLVDLVHLIELEQKFMKILSSYNYSVPTSVLDHNVTHDFVVQDIRNLGYHPEVFHGWFIPYLHNHYQNIHDGILQDDLMKSVSDHWTRDGEEEKCKSLVKFLQYQIQSKLIHNFPELEKAEIVALSKFKQISNAAPTPISLLKANRGLSTQTSKLGDVQSSNSDPEITKLESLIEEIIHTPSSSRIINISKNISSAHKMIAERYQLICNLILKEAHFINEIEKLKNNKCDFEKELKTILAKSFTRPTVLAVKKINHNKISTTKDSIIPLFSKMVTEIQNKIKIRNEKSINNQLVPLLKEILPSQKEILTENIVKYLVMQRALFDNLSDKIKAIGLKNSKLQKFDNYLNLDGLATKTGYPLIVGMPKVQINIRSSDKPKQSHYASEEPKDNSRNKVKPLKSMASKNGLNEKEKTDFPLKIKTHKSPEFAQSTSQALTIVAITTDGLRDCITSNTLPKLKRKKHNTGEDSEESQDIKKSKKPNRLFQTFNTFKKAVDIGVWGGPINLVNPSEIVNIQKPLLNRLPCELHVKKTVPGRLPSWNTEHLRVSRWRGAVYPLSPEKFSKYQGDGSMTIAEIENLQTFQIFLHQISKMAHRLIEEMGCFYKTSTNRTESQRNFVALGNICSVKENSCGSFSRVGLLNDGNYGVQIRNGQLFHDAFSLVKHYPLITQAKIKSTTVKLFEDNNYHVAYEVDEKGKIRKANIIDKGLKSRLTLYKTVLGANH